MKKLTKKEIIIIAIAGAMLLAVGLFLFFWFNREKDYRLLKVCEVDGQGSVSREGTGNLDPYVNMQLESGDRISLYTGVLNIQADEDKYIYLEEHTELLLKDMVELSVKEQEAKKKRYNWIIAITVAVLYLTVSLLTGKWQWTWIIWFVYCFYRILTEYMMKR